jgi:hypothetical protein
MFNTIERSKHFDAIKINKELQVETVLDKEPGRNLKYFVVKNVLENPDLFVELLSKHNAYGGDVEVSTPGYRQLISSLEIPTISKLYAQIFKEFTDVETKLSSWYYTTNIYHPEMVMRNNNNHPKFEPYPISTLLGLSKESKSCISFYKLKDIAGGVARHIRYDNVVRDFSEEQFKKYFPNFSGIEVEEKKWQSFGKNEYWESYAFEPIQYNTAIIYDPLFFHQIAWENSCPEQTEYVLNGFLDSPIVKFPFWESKETGQPIPSKPISPMDV